MACGIPPFSPRQNLFECPYKLEKSVRAPRAPAHGKWAFFVRMVDDSLGPQFHDGDVLVIDPDVKPKPGDYVCAKVIHLRPTAD